MKIVGYQRSQGVNKETGKPYSGYRIFCSYESPNIVGIGALVQYIGDSYMPEKPLSVGDEIEFVYNRFGRPRGVNVTKAVEF